MDGTRVLRRLLAALAVSQVGDWLYNLALLAFVYDRTHSVGWTAATTVARVLPVVVLGPFGGVLADRYDRRRLMIVSDLARLAFMALLALVAATGLPIVLAPVLAAAATAAGAAHPSAVAATMPRLVAGPDLVRANAKRSAIQSGSLIIGPLGGGVLLLLGSPAVAFLGNGLTFAASAVILLLGVRPGPAFAAPHADAGTPQLGRELRDGALALRANPTAAKLIGADVMCSLLYGAQTVLLLLLGGRLGFGDAGYGYLLAGGAVGALVGAAMAPRLRATRRAVAVTLLLSGLATAAMVVTPVLSGVLGLAVAILLTGVTGAASATAEIVTDTTLAEQLDDAVLARAYGLAYPLSIGGIAVGSLVAAPLVAWLGLAGALVAFGVLTVAYLLILAPGGVTVAVAPVLRWLRGSRADKPGPRRAHGGAEPVTVHSGRRDRRRGKGGGARRRGRSRQVPARAGAVPARRAARGAGTGRRVRRARRRGNSARARARRAA